MRKCTKLDSDSPQAPCQTKSPSQPPFRIGQRPLPVGHRKSRNASPIFVLNSLSANVSVIDPVTYKEIKRIPPAKSRITSYLTPDGKSVMVANATSDTITMIDPRTAEVQRTIKGIADPYHLRFSPDMKWFVTAANRLNHVDIYRWEQKTANTCSSRSTHPDQQDTKPHHQSIAKARWPTFQSRRPTS